MSLNDDDNNSYKLQRFYSWQARIYDATRWSFLFGRKALLQQVAGCIAPGSILEVGCGTGSTLTQLARLFPHARLTGIDLSADMLAIAKRKLLPVDDRVKLLHQTYREPLSETFDLIVFSYSLSMMNPGFEQVLQVAHRNLADDGVIAVVDFADTPSALFRRWMAMNHVRMDGHMLPALTEYFATLSTETHPVYAGLWQYLIYLGRKRKP